MRRTVLGSWQAPTVMPLTALQLLGTAPFDQQGLHNMVAYTSCHVLVCGCRNELANAGLSKVEFDGASLCFGPTARSISKAHFMIA